MRRALLWALLIAGPAGLAAQADSGAEPQAEGLRQQIRQRWHEHIRQQLGLTDDQSRQLQTTEDKYDALRRPIQQRQWAINQQLNQELQPGVAANGDAVTKLMNERADNRLRLQQVERDEDGEMSHYLTPVQRVRYQRQRQVFAERVRRLVENRARMRRERCAERGIRPRRRP